MALPSWSWHCPASPGFFQPFMTFTASPGTAQLGWHFPASPGFFSASPGTGPADPHPQPTGKIQAQLPVGPARAQPCPRMFWKAEGSGMARPAGILCLPQGTAPSQGSAPGPSRAEGSRARPDPAPPGNSLLLLASVAPSLSLSPVSPCAPAR